MSGFGGIVLPGGQKVELQEIMRMSNALSPYGPDRQQSLLRPGVGFLHTLMRITPEDYFERQPLAAPSGVVLCADARIDNRLELAEKLSIQAARLKTMPDSQLILMAYERWGETCPEYLLGDFAFALWDPHKKKLFAARDHFGTRVLFYSNKGHFFAFANDMKALLALPQICDELDPQKLAEFAVLMHGDTHASFYKEIRRLPPAHTLTLENNQVRLRRYYSLEENVRDVRFSSYGEYGEALKEQLNQAVLCRMRSAYPIGCELSGGLDSPSVAGLAAIELAKQGKTLETFTAVPPLGYQGAKRRGWELDERPYIQAFSEMHENVNLNLLEVDPVDHNLFSLLDDTFRRQGFPNRGATSTWGNAICDMAADKGIRVMLNAGMGNLTISWTGQCLYSELLQQKHLFTWLKSVNQARQNSNASLKSLLATSLVSFIPDTLWRSYRYWRDGHKQPWMRYSLLNPKMAKQQNIDVRYGELNWDPYYRRLVKGRDSRIIQLEKRNNFDGRDQNSAMRALTGVERRDPTRDKRLVEFCFGIEEAIYCHAGQQRSLVRRAMRGVVPEAILQRQSRGMQPPNYSNYFHEPSTQLWQQFEQLKQSESVGEYLDLSRMEKILQHTTLEKSAESDLARLKRMLERAYSIGGFISYNKGINHGK